jgi:thymidylate synthase (FAD)
MTKQVEVLQNKDYIPLFNEGFVGLRSFMGDDQQIVDAARVSYGKGTKSVSSSRGLIRYLMRLEHSSPFEQVEFQFHVKLPVFVARQWMRHRTFSYSEISFRYSEIEDDFYMPENYAIMPQSTDNKQGRNGYISDKNKNGVKWIFNAAFEHCINAYKVLLGEKGKIAEDFYDIYSKQNSLLDDDFEGVAREIARGVVSTSIYTEFLVKGNLRNWLHFTKLRSDNHAQLEIREYSNAVYNLIKNITPIACEAFEDYKKSSYNLSRMDIEFIKSFTSSGKSFDDWYSELSTQFSEEKSLTKHFGMTERELRELKEKVLGK